MQGLAAKAGVPSDDSSEGHGRPFTPFAEPDDVNPFEAFADPVPFLLPRNAVDYFQQLVPTLGVDPERYGPLMDRHAFTMAHAADQVVLGRVKTALSQWMSGQRDDIEGTADVPGFGRERGGEVVERMLNAAGVTPSNPQYCELVYRTNLMDSYQQGVSADATPDQPTHTSTFDADDDGRLTPADPEPGKACDPQVIYLRVTRPPRRCRPRTSSTGRRGSGLTPKSAKTGRSGSRKGSQPPTAGRGMPHSPKW